MKEFPLLPLFSTKWNLALIEVAYFAEPEAKSGMDM